MIGQVKFEICVAIYFSVSLSRRVVSHFVYLCIHLRRDLPKT